LKEHNEYKLADHAVQPLNSIYRVQWLCCVVKEYKWLWGYPYSLVL